MSNDKSSSVLNQRRSRRQVLAAMGLGAAALYVAPTLVSMGQAEARGHRSSRPSYSRPSYSRPSYSRHHRSHLQRHDKYYSRPYRSRYVRSGRSRWEHDGVIEIRLSRVLPRW